MADQKISELNSIATSALVDSDVFVVVDSSATETKKIDWGSLKIPHLTGARVSNTANKGSFDFTTQSVVSFDLVEYNVTSWWDVNTPWRFVVPDAYNGMFVDCGNFINLVSASGSGWLIASVKHFNAAGTQVNQQLSGRGEAVTLGSAVRRAETHMVMEPVNSGDYFECLAQVTIDAATDVHSNSYFYIRLAGQ